MQTSESLRRNWGGLLLMIGDGSISANSVNVSSTALLSTDKTDQHHLNCLNKQSKRRNGAMSKVNVNHTWHLQ